MRDNIEYDEKVARLNITTARRIDALTAREMAHHARRMEMFRFIGEAVSWLAGLVAGWYRGLVLEHELARLPDYLLADIGLRRDRFGDVVAISVDPMEPAFAGQARNMGARGHRTGAADDTPLAA